MNKSVAFLHQSITCLFAIRFVSRTLLQSNSYYSLRFQSTCPSPYGIIEQSLPQIICSQIWLIDGLFDGIFIHEIRFIWSYESGKYAQDCTDCRYSYSNLWSSLPYSLNPLMASARSISHLSGTDRWDPTTASCEKCCRHQHVVILYRALWSWAV